MYIYVQHALYRQCIYIKFNSSACYIIICFPLYSVPILKSQLYGGELIVNCSEVLDVSPN